MSSSLSDSQKRQIESFKSISNINSNEIAISALTNFNWNFEQCIANFFENPQSLSNVNQEREEEKEEKKHDFHPNQEQKQEEKEIEQNEEQSNISWVEYATGNLYEIAMYVPINVCTWISSVCYAVYPSLCSVMNSFYNNMNKQSSYIPYQQILQEFHSKYPSFSSFSSNKVIFEHPLRYLIRDHSQKCILLYFYNDSNIECDIFVKNILNNEEVLFYILRNFNFWIADVQRNREAHDLYSQMTIHQRNAAAANGNNAYRMPLLSNMMQPKLPFICIAGIHPFNKRLVLVQRSNVSHILNGSQFVGFLDQGLQKWKMFEQQELFKNEQLANDRFIRENQDREYERALQTQISNDTSAVDACEQSSVASVMKSYDNIVQCFKQRSVECMERVLCLECCGKCKMIRVSVRFQNGKRAEKKFCVQHTMQNVFDFVQCREELDVENIANEVSEEESELELELVSIYPKLVIAQFHNENEGVVQQSLESLGIQHSVLFHVQWKT